MNNLSDKAELTNAAYWDNVWRGLPQVRIISAGDRRFGQNGEFVRIVRRYVGNLAGRSILELGGARSYRALALAKWCGAKITIVDYSSVGLDITQKIFKTNNCAVETKQVDFFNWDTGGQKFDVVTHFGVLEHFTDPTSVLKLCADLLLPHGVLLFTMPNMAAWGASLWRRWSPDDWQKHIYHPDQCLREAGETVGLEIIKTFHSGPPMLQLGIWERQGLLPRLVTLAQGALNRVDLVLKLYDRGLPHLSTDRGFVARKLA